MKINVMLGQDMSAYADVELDVPDNASKEEIIERVQEFTDNADFSDVVFDEDWSTTCALRIVSIKIGNDLLLEEVPLEPSPFDAGQVLQSWLRGLSSQTISCSILRVIVFFAHGLAAISGSTASSAGCEACGEEGSGRRRKTAVKPPR